MLGALGEHLAAEYLTGKGLRIVARNWRAPGMGELDLVAVEGDTIVFVEVKTRWDASPTEALELVTPEKLARLQRLERAWMQENHSWGNSRIDAIGICCLPRVTYEWLRGIE